MPKKPFLIYVSISSVCMVAPILLQIGIKISLSLYSCDAPVTEVSQISGCVPTRQVHPDVTGDDGTMLRKVWCLKRGFKLFGLNFLNHIFQNKQLSVFRLLIKMTQHDRATIRCWCWIWKKHWSSAFVLTHELLATSNLRGKGARRLPDTGRIARSNHLRRFFRGFLGCRGIKRACQKVESMQCSYENRVL